MAWVTTFWSSHSEKLFESSRASFDRRVAFRPVGQRGGAK